MMLEMDDKKMNYGEFSDIQLVSLRKKAKEEGAQDKIGRAHV